MARTGEAAKAVAGKKIRWAYARGGSSPPARTTLPAPTDLVFPANHNKQFNAILEETA